MVTLTALGWLLFLTGVLLLLLNWREIAASLFPVDYETYIRSARWKSKARAARRSKCITRPMPAWAMGA